MAQGAVQKIEISELNPDRFPVLDLIRPSLVLRKTEDSLIQVQDPLRKKWLVLSPEEWVRQHVVHWLLYHTGYPSTLLSLERGVKGRQAGRSDVLGFDRNASPLLLVECKSAEVEISSETALQAMNYNSILRARFIWLSNGRNHKVLELDASGILKQEHNILPLFEEMLKAAS